MVEQQVAQRAVHLPKDEIIRLVDADLNSGIVEILGLERLYDWCWPASSWHFRIEKLRRPATKKYRPSANAIS